MKELCQKIVEELKKQNKTIAFMESCTGGFLANCITNISGASNVLKVSLVTYSSAYKEKFGVDKNIIEKYTVYSSKVARQMAKKISEFAKSDIGVGITGELGNTINKEPKIYYAIYLVQEKKYIEKVVQVKERERSSMKEELAEYVFKDIKDNI